MIYLLPVRVRRQRVDVKHARNQARKLVGRPIRQVFVGERLAEAAHIVAALLEAKTIVDSRFEPFDLGRHRNRKPARAELAMEAMVEKAHATNNWTIPISGGDSWCSYLRRLWKGVVDGLLTRDEHIVLVLDERMAQTLQHLSSRKWKKDELEPAEALLRQRFTVSDQRVYVLRNVGA